MDTKKVPDEIKKLQNEIDELCDQLCVSWIPFKQKFIKMWFNQYNNIQQ